MRALSAPKMHGVYLWCSRAPVNLWRIRVLSCIFGAGFACSPGSLVQDSLALLDLWCRGAPVNLRRIGVLSLRPRCTECIFGAVGATFYSLSPEHMGALPALKMHRVYLSCRGATCYGPSLEYLRALTAPKMHGVYLWRSGGHLLRSVPGTDECSPCAQDARSVSLVQGGATCYGPSLE